jgi:hypothetical protein
MALSEDMGAETVAAVKAELIFAENQPVLRKRPRASTKRRMQSRIDELAW